MVDELINKGVAEVGNNAGVIFSDGLPRPVVVVGTARGGTSMIAGALHHLGLFTGDKSHPPVFEDVRLATAFESGELDEARQIAVEYSRRGAQWVWKRPSSINYLPTVHDVIGQPVYVFVFKDIFSISQRNSISMLTDLLNGMENAHKQYGKVLEFLRTAEPSALLVSYEKALAYPDHFLAKLQAFCGIQPTASQLEAAKAFIDPAPEKYLDVSRITKAQGRLGGINNGVIFGWARFVHRPSVAADVQIFLNDEEIATVKADKPRTDLRAKFNQDCAYTYKLPEDINLKPGDQLRARAQGEVRDLDNSPLVL